MFKFFLIFLTAAGLLLTSCVTDKGSLAKIVNQQTRLVTPTSGRSSSVRRGNKKDNSSQSKAKQKNVTFATTTTTSHTKVSSPLATGTTVPIYGLPTTTTNSSGFATSKVLAGTYPWGVLQSLGPVNRIQFPPLLTGQLTLSPNPPLGLPTSELITIGYRSFGQGQDLVLLGGQDSTMTTWPPDLLLALEQNFHVIIFDLPGTGYSPMPEQKLNLTNISNDVAGFIAALNLHSPIMLGWGLGGTISARVAEMHPGLLGGLILVDSSAGGKKSVGRESLTGPMSHISSWFTHNQSSAEAAYVSSLSDYAPDILLPTGYTVWNSLAKQSLLDNFIYDKLHLIDVATLIVVGDSDSVFPPRDSEILHQSIATSRLIRYRNSSYATIIADSSQLVSSLQQFATSVTTTTG